MCVWVCEREAEYIVWKKEILKGEFSRTWAWKNVVRKLALALSVRISERHFGKESDCS